MSHAPYDGTERTFSEVLEFLTTTYRIYGRLQNWSINRFGNWRFGGNSKKLKTDPTFFSRNLHIWYDGSTIAGVAVSEGGGEVTLQLHPDNRELAGEMLDWAEEERRASGRCSVCRWSNDAWLMVLLRERGYKFAESGGLNRKYDTSLSPHRSPLPDGFEISDSSRLSAEEYVRAVSGAFGRDTLDMEWYDSNARAPARDPRWMICMTAPGNRCASFADVRIDGGAGYAEIDPVGTHPDFQRLGLARACLAECFRRLHHEGIRHAYIGSAPEPAPSNRLYDSLRPIEVYEEQVWEKRP